MSSRPLQPVVWIEVANALAYLQATLAIEAPDIPLDLYMTGVWHQTVFGLADIDVDTAMLAAHERNPVHQQRVQNWIQQIRIGRPLLPLIILACDRAPHYLVDGYARYQALRRLGVAQVQVLCQRSDVTS